MGGAVDLKCSQECFGIITLHWLELDCSSLLAEYCHPIDLVKLGSPGLLELGRLAPEGSKVVHGNLVEAASVRRNFTKATLSV